MANETFDDKFGTDEVFAEMEAEETNRANKIQKEATAKIENEARQKQMREHAKKVIDEAGNEFTEADGATKLSMISDVAQGAAQQQLKARKGTANVHSQIDAIFKNSLERPNAEAMGEKFKASKVLNGRLKKAMYRYDGDVAKALKTVFKELSPEEMDYLNKPEGSEDTGSW